MVENIDAKNNKKIESDLYNLAGEIVGKLSLPEEIFSIKANPQLVAQVTRVYLANQRLGTHNTKTRSQVTGSTRKIYRQKGTGRARHGDVKAPIFIGGGIAFGPKPRDYSLDIPKKSRRKSLFTVLTDKYISGKIKAVSGMQNIEPKTRIIAQFIDKLYINSNPKNQKPKILLVTPQNIKNILLSGRNIENLAIKEASLLNTYDVLSHSELIFMEEAVGVLKSHFLKKNENQLTKGIKEQTKKPMAIAKSKTTIKASKTKQIKKRISHKI